MSKFIYFIGLVIACSAVTAKCDEVSESVVNQIQDFRRNFSIHMTEEERSIVDSINIVSPISNSYGHVNSFLNKDDRRIISFNTGSYILYSQLAKALYLTTVVIKDDAYLFGYIRYLAYANLFNKLITPEQFARYYGFQNLEDITKNESVSSGEREIWDRANFSIIGFIVAHEIAHHVLDHVGKIDANDTSIQTLLANRKDQEIEADKWALNLTLKAGLNPSFAIFSLLILSEIEGRSISYDSTSTHPPAIIRSLLLSENLLNFIKNNEQKIRAASTNGANYESLLLGIKKLHNLLQAMFHKQQKIDQDKKVWKEYADSGDRFAQLKLGELYSTGKDEYPYDLDRALFWYKKAADNSSRFDFVDLAHAEYSIGHMYAFRENVARNYELACLYLKRSSDKGHIIGLRAYQKLINDNQCNL